MNMFKNLAVMALVVGFIACGDDSSTGSPTDAKDDGSSSSVISSDGSSFSESVILGSSSSVIPSVGSAGVEESSSSSSSSSSVNVSLSSSQNQLSSSSSSSSVDKFVWSYLNTDIEYEEFTDERDGQVYKSVKIGDQVWMAENLNYAYVVPTAEWDSSSFCYDDELDNCAKYGRLYLWSAAMDSAAVFSESGRGCGFGVECNPNGIVRGVCPEGWHLPSSEEWYALHSSVGGYLTAGKMLRTTSDWHNNSNGTDGNGTNAYGFSVYPSGYRHVNSVFYSRLGYDAHFWMADEWSKTNASYEELVYGYDYTTGDADPKNLGYSVRCLMD
ncbi:fibrobacter succinogenes major paralogous domain-containing protein [Fibrobacter sp. UWEL]|uniref:fibrobacter succinogenes major paralogous domain-containing protein n=1 Tax=Fibrobacter sp. UWEL TaxID=1896209 RepID=UPI00092414A4|nr:fibrobacter succinogenes major paralogous domain-containing protein [Fibrobacter sp. UWEL]SHK47920.1 major paralogous domain-containing protein [Fibrobacter sp. UWEL]